MNLVKKMNNVGDRIYYRPTPLLNYKELVRRSLGSNTYRGFHRLDKNRPGASYIFRSVLTQKS